MTSTSETIPVSIPPTPDPDGLSPRGPGFAVLFTVTVLASLVAAWTAATAALGVDRQIVLLPLALCAAVMFAVLAVTRFEAFLLVVLALRTSLDALKLESSTQIGPAAATGLLLLAIVPLWLVLQHRSGYWRFRLTRTGIVVGVFTAAAAVGIVVSPQPLDSAVEWSRFAAAAAMFFAVEQIALRSQRFKRHSLVAVALALPIPLIAAASQLASGEGLKEVAGFARISGTFTHSNPLAAFLAVLLIMAVAVAASLSGRPRGLALVVAAVSVAALLLTYTRGAWIGAILGVLVVAVVMRRWKLLVGLVAIVAAVVLLVPGAAERAGSIVSPSGPAPTTEQRQDSLAWRLGYWRDSIELANESPIAGIGLKQVAESLPAEKTPHNDFVRAYVELGAVGLLAFIVLVGHLLWIGPRAVSRLRRSGRGGLDLALAAGFSGVATCYAVMSLSANLMSQTVVLLYVMTFAALASAVLNRDDVAELQENAA